jgi:hypothetical protein
MTITEIVVLIPQFEVSQGIESRCSEVSTEFTMPNDLEKTEPNTIAMATMDVTLGKKYATR